jgi:hypothetical protein
MLMVVAGLAAAVAAPAASAGALAPAKQATAHNTCPSGNAGDGNYCEPVCIVPRLEGFSLSRAILRLSLSNCTLGHVFLILHSGVKAPPLTTSFFSVFTVVKQFPQPGAIRPPHFRVTLYVAFG